MNEELKKEFDGLLLNVKEQVKTQLEDVTKNLEGNDQLKENLSNLEKGLEKVTEQVKNLTDNNDMAKLKEAMEDIEKVVQMQATLIDANKNKNSSGLEVVTFKDLADKFTDSDAYKNYLANPNGNSQKMELKDVSLSGNYIGFANKPATLTDQTGVVVIQPYQENNIRARDLMPTSPIDVPFVISEEIVDWVNTIDVNSENGTLVEFDFKAEYKTFEKKRIGAYTKISKDMIESRPFIVSQVQNVLPRKYYYKENQEMFRGSGTGNHLQGIFTNANVRTFALNGTFAAGSIASVSSFGDGSSVLIEFTNDHKLWEGYKLTIANATEATYNDAFNVHVHTKKKIVIEVAYVVEADTSAWTGTFEHPRYKKVFNPNIGDVASNAMRALNQGFNKTTAILINPYDASDLNDLKDTTGQYVMKFVDTQGNVVINRVPVVESDAVTIGEIWLGDFAGSAAVFDYKDLEMYMSTDVSYQLNNQVALILEAHVILANYNPLMFMKVNIAGAKTGLSDA